MFVMTVSGVANLINYDKTAHKNYLLTKYLSPRTFLFFRSMELNSANSIDQSDRIPLHIMRDEVDRSVAGLQNTVIKSSVLARK